MSVRCWIKKDVRSVEGVDIFGDVSGLDPEKLAAVINEALNEMLYENKSTVSVDLGELFEGMPHRRVWVRAYETETSSENILSIKCVDMDTGREILREEFKPAIRKSTY